MTLLWDAIDFERALVTLTDTKTGRSERPLGDAALAVLRQQPKVDGNLYVSPGRLAGQPVRESHAELYLPCGRIRHEVARPAAFISIGGRRRQITNEQLRPLLGHTGECMTDKYGGVPDEVVNWAANPERRQ